MLDIFSSYEFIENTNIQTKLFEKFIYKFFILFENLNCIKHSDTDKSIDLLNPYIVKPTERYT